MEPAGDPLVAALRADSWGWAIAFRRLRGPAAGSRSPRVPGPVCLDLLLFLGARF